MLLPKIRMVTSTGYGLSSRVPHVSVRITPQERNVSSSKSGPTMSTYGGGPLTGRPVDNKEFLGLPGRLIQ